MDREVGKDITERLVHSQYYHQPPISQSGRPFFVFVRPGDFLKGQLIGRSGNKAMFRSTAFAIQVEEGKQGGDHLDIVDGQVEEFCANAQVQRIIKKNQLMKAIIKIVYVGKFRYPKALHATKVYRIYKEVGTFRSNEQPQTSTKPKPRPFKQSGAMARKEA
jgi:hypothetical protein